MHFSFQTLAVGAVVTVIHLAVIAAMQPATLEASKYFQALEMDAFVEEVLVKADADTPGLEVGSGSPTVAGVEDVRGRASGIPVPEEAPMGGPEQPVQVAEKFLDLEQEMDSVKAVSDVRIFAGRISAPKLDEFTSEPIIAEPVAEPPVEKKSSPVAATKQKPKKTGPFELREILPLSRP
jgi:hypothetical protein